MKRLYELARMLLALPPEAITPPRLLALFHDVFALRAIYLFENDPSTSHIVGEPSFNLEERTHLGYLSGIDSDDPVCRVSIRCLRAGSKTVGALGFEWPDHSEFTPDSVSALEAAMLERMRAFRTAAQAAAAAEADNLRAAILDALAYTVKTPLATIFAAAGGLRETAGLKPDQLEFIDVVENEAARLAGLTTRLLRMAALDREEVKPRLKAVDITDLIAEELNSRSSQYIDHKLSLSGDDSLPKANADPELLRLALAQIDRQCMQVFKAGIGSGTAYAGKQGCCCNTRQKSQHHSSGRAGANI